MKTEWKVIPEFPNYMISQEGQVRNHISGRLVVPTVTPDREYLRLHKDGQVYNRGVRGLVRATWYPVVHPTEMFEEWMTIPDFEQYEVNTYGRVRRKSTRRELKTQTNSGTYVNLSKGGRTIRRSVSSILHAIYVGMQ